MNSQQMKCELLQYLLYERRHLAAFTEGFWNSDVLAVSDRRYSTEVEVKVDRSDLVRELGVIQWVLNPVFPLVKRISSSKRWKHETFLKDRSSKVTPIPNSFYFAVPPQLAQVATAGVENTPYGVMTVHDGSDGMKGVFLRKPASKIHDEKLSEVSMLRLMRKVSNENYALRRRLLNHGMSTEDLTT